MLQGLRAVAVDRDRLLRTFLELVAIDSPTGHEEEIGNVLEARFRELGCAVTRDPIGNVIAGPGADTDIDNAQSSLAIAAGRTGSEAGSDVAGTVGAQLAGAWGSLPAWNSPRR